MYNRDCLTFALHLARHLHPSLFPSHLWDLFIGRSAQPSGAGFSSTPGGLNPSKPSWVRDESAAAYHDLAAAVPDLVESCGLHDAGVWAPWVSSSQVASLPAQVARKLDAFQGLLLVKAFRPDRWGMHRHMHAWQYLVAFLHHLVACMRTGSSCIQFKEWCPVAVVPGEDLTCCDCVTVGHVAACSSMCDTCHQ